MLLTGGLAGADTAPAAAADERPAPSWGVLSEQAEELSAGRFSPEALAGQVEQKEAHLRSLGEQQAALEAEVENIVASTSESLAEIEAIDDPVLRDESLLRFRASKDIRLKTLRATLDAVNEAIEREQGELRTLQRLLQSRRAEARLYGHSGEAGAAYRAFLAAEAARVRESEHAALGELRRGRLVRLEAVILPLAHPRAPGLVEAVLARHAEE